MKLLEIKNSILVLSKHEISGFIADHWNEAQNALSEISDVHYRETPIAQYPLQLLCLISDSKDGFIKRNSAQKEQIIERMKSALVPVTAYLKSDTELELPSYSLVSSLIPQDGEYSFFSEQLKDDFKRLNQNSADSLAKVLYASVYACYGSFDDRTIDFTLKQLVGDPYDFSNCSGMSYEEQADILNESGQKTYVTPQTKASAAYASSPTVSGTYHPVKVIGTWLPLKIYLISTTLFVVLVFTLVFFSMSSGVGSSAMSIMNTDGQMVSIEPGMEPATLFLFGTVEYDGLISGIKKAVIIFVIWRVVLTSAVYIFNAGRRRRYHP